MACRVRIKLKRDEACIEISALINSGFETEAPDIVVPVEVARRLGLWPLRHADFTMLDTGGGNSNTIL
ncbi:MAG: pepsin/retropepsin-like aspartic protease family protein [Candidatus Nezhaarchaeales archaeon]